METQRGALLYTKTTKTSINYYHNLAWPQSQWTTNTGNSYDHNVVKLHHYYNWPIRFNATCQTRDYRLTSKSLNYLTIISASDMRSTMRMNRSPVDPIVRLDMIQLIPDLWEDFWRLSTWTNMSENYPRIWTSWKPPSATQTRCWSTPSPFF